MLTGMELNAIQDENARQLIRRLLNLIEKLSADLRDLQAENQVLRDENKHRKGEQRKPKVKANKGQPRGVNIRRRKSGRKGEFVTN